jgi:hypothetical protein
VTIDKIDVTDRAVSGGWTLPAGWTVRADMSYDDGIGGTEYGDYVMTDEDDTVTGHTWIDPLNAPIGEYNVVREYDLIGEALRDAVAELERFGTPVLVEPAGDTVTGL